MKFKSGDIITYKNLVYKIIGYKMYEYIVLNNKSRRGLINITLADSIFNLITEIYKYCQCWKKEY